MNTSERFAPSRRFIVITSKSQFISAQASSLQTSSIVAVNPKAKMIDLRPLKQDLQRSLPSDSVAVKIVSEEPDFLSLEELAAKSALMLNLIRHDLFGSV